MFPKALTRSLVVLSGVYGPVVEGHVYNIQSCVEAWPAAHAHKHSTLAFLGEPLDHGYSGLKALSNWPRLPPLYLHRLLRSN